MALHNPSNLYSGGQGIFDSRPSLMFQANLFNQKKAKEEAVSKYLEELPSKINSAGLQTKDLPEFDNIMGQISDYWKNNKQDIINPKNSIAQSEYSGLIEKAKRHILKSKNGLAALEPFINTAKDPKKISRLPNSVLQNVSLAELPVNDPNYREFQASDMEFNNEPFDWAKQSKAFTNIKPNDSGIEIVTDPKTLTKTVITKSSFDDAAKSNIYNIAASKYHSDPSVVDFVQDELSKPQNYNNLNTDFKKQYGRDIDINKPEELYAAYAIGSLQGDKVKMKVSDDSNAKIDKNFSNAKTMEGIRQANRKELASIQSSLRRSSSLEKQQDALNNLEQYFNNQIANGQKISPFIGQMFGIDSKDYLLLPMTNEDLENFETTTTSTNEKGNSVTVKIRPKKVLYNTKTEEYMPIGDGFTGQKFKRDGMRIAYVNHSANTVPKINILAGSGVKGGQTKETQKSSSSSSKKERPNLQKTNKTKISW